MLSAAVAASTGTDRPWTSHVGTQTVRHRAWEGGGEGGGGSRWFKDSRAHGLGTYSYDSPYGLHLELEMRLEGTREILSHSVFQEYISTLKFS